MPKNEKKAASESKTIVDDISALAAIWEQRNGRVDVRPVSDANGVVLYSTKQAALAGEIVLSDTLAPYRERLTAKPQVDLYPRDDSDDRQESATQRERHHE